MFRPIVGVFLPSTTTRRQRVFPSKWSHRRDSSRCSRQGTPSHRMLQSSGLTDPHKNHADAGVASAEVTSFVSPKEMPQLADAAEVLGAVHAQLMQLRACVMVPNLKGLERVRAAGAQEIAIEASATEIVNQRNINMSLGSGDGGCRTDNASRRSGRHARVCCGGI